ncbi:MAG: electron transfer flavoprotein subunit beta [Sulfobacillus benefaciens]|uniref:Electron transfer flavoprotein subunit beta n=1 Tax=Sulfobacillus benefaciens TaxID=453960 RepID=A0A2T2X2Y8_9FIRM|nr:MAG: electron transfer flavoprotein subunit beta [Sulfobacillus benefaciens]
MKVLVMVKQVPDTETRIKIRPDGQGIVEDGIKWVINPYDEFAVEESLRIREKFGGETVVVALGPKRVEEAVRQSLAMGADRAVIIESADMLEPSLVVQALAKVVKEEGFDLIITGKQAVDDDSAQVGPMLAARLGLPHASIVIKLDIDDSQNKLRVERELEGATEVVELPFPSVITAQRGLNEPRYPTLPNIMKAKKKEVKRIPLDSLSIDPSPRIRLIQLSPPPDRPQPTVLTGEPAETAKKLAELLHEQAKVI